MVVAVWVAALGYAVGGEPVDVLFVGGLVVVGEVVAVGGGWVEDAGEEGGYLGSGDGFVRAVVVVAGWVASLGYARPSDGNDVGLTVHALDVNEQGRGRSATFPVSDDPLPGVRPDRRV